MATIADVSCGDQVFALDFHPIGEYVATGIIDGSVEIWQYGVGEGACVKLLRVKNHTTSCRGVKFNSTGDILYTVSSDKSIRAIDGSGVEICVRPNAHTAAINRLEVILDNVLVTGDDSGAVKIWDTRILGADMQPAMEWRMHEDYIAGLAFNADADAIVSVGGDNTFCTYDLRNPANHYHSDQWESELHCVNVMHGGESIAMGTESGEIVTFRWDQWGDCSDRFPGHPEAVDCMLKVDESTVVTGSSDGLLRVVSLQPNKVLGVIGDHEEFPVEGLSASRDGRVLASFAHDEVVRFWDLTAALSGADGFASEEPHFAAGLI
jgi:hypothetical protein